MGGLVHIHADVWKRGRYYIAYCPVVDIASQGGSRKTAVSNLIDAIRIHAEEKKGQFEDASKFWLS